MIPLQLDRFRNTASTLAPAARAGACLALAVLMLMSSTPVAGADTGDRDKAALVREIITLMRQDQRAEALPLCRTYNDRFPGDPVMLYNQACLENTSGLADEAVATFARAVDAGFDDFQAAFEDPDLAGLKHHPAMVELSVEHQIRLTQAAGARAVSLGWETRSGAIPLAEPVTGTTSGGPVLFLTWSPTGLEVELQAAEPWSSLVGPDLPAPWNGGPGLIFTLGIPDDGDAASFRTSNHFIFAFGTENDRPVGAIHLSGQDRWQPIAELQPKIRLDDPGNLELRALIPWAAILPYDPLVDDHLGFNAALRVAREDDPLAASILPDPAAFRPRSGTRRIVPLTFETGSVAGEVFVGKVSRTISGADPITLDLVAISTEEGAGRLTIDFLGGPQQSLLPEGQVSGTINLKAGLNKLTRQADFSALKTGAYVIKAEMTFPSGRALSWGSSILQLAPGWHEDYAARIDGLNAQEKPTALFHLETVTEAVAAHHQRRGPGAIVTTLDELGRLLDSAEKEGSILPEKGSFLAVYPGPDGDPRLCHIYLPARWRIAKQLNPVLTLTAPTDLAGALADRMGQNYEQGRQKPTLKAAGDAGFPVYLVPRLAPVGEERSGHPLAEAAACLSWARETFGTETASVAGVDQGAGTALLLAAESPEELMAVIIYAGSDLDPWPQADAEFIEGQLVGFPAELPVTWTDFVSETEISGQGPLILEALRRIGANVVDVQEVRGGLNFTQAADRTVLWAEGLR